MRSSEESLTPSEALKKLVIPWVQRWGMTRIFIAYPQWKNEMDSPDGINVTQTPIRGPRVPMKAGRYYGGSTVVDAEWPEDELHSARTPKLCFILNGPAAIRIADYTVHCQPGHGLLLPPGIPFATGRLPYLDKTRPHQDVCELLQLMPYHGGVISWVTRERYGGSGKKYSTETTSSIPHSRVSFYLAELLKETNRRNSYQSIISDSLLTIVVTLLQRELQQLPVVRTGAVHPAPEAMLSGEKEYSILQAQEYIHSNLREVLSIDRVARFVCMSRTSFTEQFRRHTGTTFTEYVINRRFEEARKILLGTDLAVRHVGLLVGLNPNRMRVLFQQREGLSPTAFRIRERKNPH